MKRPPYSIFPTLTNGNISLRNITAADMPDLMEISFYDTVQATTVEIAAEMQNKINKDYFEGNSVHWGIADKATNKILGTCGYYRGFENDDGELGCVLLPESQGKGYMTQALSLASDFGLKEMKLKRIWAVTNRDNHPAIKLLERLKFKKIDSPKLEYQEVEFELINSTSIKPL
ncbi:MAG: N-acetyltransferase [Chryseobacterium sp.]|jgi:ribosomal-protein-alanine N-acetyltransferase|uniref:GNAT family N-acetyltransferase n=1 Tax=Chryseobacterium sp. TaxID=1871047 RepID=UPI002630D60B|nr:GNAT family N-acetyltransferase [Chryseobacterium sp.]MDF2553693.1 N-acetyltransferase [Chryseobacterium sp.]